MYRPERYCGSHKDDKAVRLAHEVHLPHSHRLATRIMRADLQNHSPGVWVVMTKATYCRDAPRYTGSLEVRTVIESLHMLPRVVAASAGT